MLSDVVRSAVHQVDADLLAAPVVRLGHEQSDEHEADGWERGERGPQLHRVLFDERFERLHDDERQGPREGRDPRLDAAGAVLGRHQLGGHEPRDGSQAGAETEDENAEDEQYRHLPRRVLQRSCGEEIKVKFLYAAKG